MTNAYRRVLRLSVGLSLASMALVLLASPQAFAGAPRSEFVATCENGHSYPIRARAVSDYGDLVTGDLLIGRRHAAAIRLIPMGVGYRYAAKGLWLDGFRSDAELYFGKHREVACTVASN
jgi:hypothetical protein